MSRAKDPQNMTEQLSAGADPSENTAPANYDGLSQVWVDTESHTVPMICWGTPSQHKVLSPRNAHYIGTHLLAAVDEITRARTGQPQAEDA